MNSLFFKLYYEQFFYVSRLFFFSNSQTSIRLTYSNSSSSFLSHSLISHIWYRMQFAHQIECNESIAHWWKRIFFSSSLQWRPDIFFPQIGSHAVCTTFGHCRSNYKSSKHEHMHVCSFLKKKKKLIIIRWNLFNQFEACKWVSKQINSFKI